MKNRYVVILVAMLVVSSALFVGAHTLSSAQENVPPVRTLEGTWLTTVTLVNCDTGQSTGTKFDGILSFHKGGTMSGTSTIAPSVFGVWTRGKGWGDYSFAFTNLRYNSSGIHVGRQAVRQTVQLSESGNEFTSTGTVQMFDTNGNQVGQGCANSIGTRFE